MTFNPPFARRLNEYYGRNFHFRYDRARSEPTSMGIIIESGDDEVTVNGLDNDEVIHKLLESCNCNAEVSQAGRISRRLLRHMGGLQKCRVFKMRGVRDLIREYSAQKAFIRPAADKEGKGREVVREPGQQSFTRSAALQKIGQVHNGTLHFSDYEDLFIEPRKGKGKMTPEMAFTYLLKKKVFRVGLDLLCPNCELAEWRPLDEVKTDVECGLCGHTYNVLPYLKDRDWRFRCSGLFHRFEHQEGAIPVVLLLQQLDTDIGVNGNVSAFSTCTNIRLSNGIKCETDCVWIVNIDEGRPAIAIGECKDVGGRINQEDVDKLGALAAQLREEGLDAFIILAKLAAFEDAEVALSRNLRVQGRERVVMLTAHELETYGIWQEESAPFARIGIERLCSITTRKYFQEETPDR